MNHSIRNWARINIHVQSKAAKCSPLCHHYIHECTITLITVILSRTYLKIIIKAELFFQAFKNHKQHDPLSEPGTADLTADVDFDFLKDQVKEKLITFGPVTQSSFLINMGIETRLHVSLVPYLYLFDFRYLVQASAL